MNRHVNAISARLSLRAPQRESLEILARIAEAVPLTKQYDLSALLSAIQSDFSSVEDFERDFPSLCFALATPHSDSIPIQNAGSPSCSKTNRMT